MADRSESGPAIRHPASAMLAPVGWEDDRSGPRRPPTPTLPRKGGGSWRTPIDRFLETPWPGDQVSRTPSVMTDWREALDAYLGAMEEGLRTLRRHLHAHPE